MPVDPRLLADSYSPSSMGQLWVPVLPKDKLSLLSNEQLYKYHAARKKADELAKENPVAAGWKLPAWQGVLDNWGRYPIHIICGGVRSGKSTLASRLCVWALGNIPEAQLRCYHVNGDRSQQDQQKFIWDALPNKLQNLPVKKSFSHSVQYNQRTGFTNDMLILPPLQGWTRGGRIDFGNYKQWESDNRVTEGFKSHVIWCIAEGELVQMADGTLKPIETVKVGDTVLTIGHNGQWVNRKVLAAQKTGEKECVLLKSRTAAPVVCTEDHEIYWGYYKASKKKASEATHIAQIRLGWWPENTSDRDDYWYIWSAMIVSEGCFRDKMVSKTNDAVMEKAAASLPEGIKVKRYKYDNHVPTWKLRFPELWNEIGQFMSYNVGIPDFVFKSSKEKAALFLSWLYFGDGWANGHVIGYGSTSKKLAVQIMVLLRRLGIRSTFSIRPPRGNWREQYWVTVCKAEDVLKFCNEIGIVGKETAVNKVREEAKRRLVTTKNRGVHLRTTGNGAEWVARSRRDKDKKSRIVSKAKVGIKPVYDLTIEGEHRFLIGTSLVSNCDESAPLGFFETILYRTPDFNGRVLLTFTTVDGWTPLVQDILGRTRTLESRYSHRLKRKLPTMQESLSRKGALIHYFWTEDNPWVGGDAFMKLLDGRPQDEVLCRAYGIPTKTATAVFTKFDRTINVIKHEDLPFIKNKDYKVTRYMAIDPAGSKNWFMLWVAIDASNTWWVYREWPPEYKYGAWAEAGPTIEGKPGPAQRSLGWGIKDYVDEIRAVEEGEEIFERLIDPRMGNAEKQSANEGATTIISDLDKHDITAIPAPGVEIESGLQVIKDLLAWNEDKMRDSVNTPHLFVSDRCENFIHAMCEYTAKGGASEATKDCIDPLRYLAVSGARFFASEDMQRDYGTAM